MISAFGVNHGVIAKSQLPGGGYKRAVDLNDTEKRNVRFKATHGTDWYRARDDGIRANSPRTPLYGRGFAASRYRPETVAEFRDRSHARRAATRELLGRPVPKGGGGRAKLALAGAAAGTAAAGGVTAALRRKKAAGRV